VSATLLATLLLAGSPQEPPPLVFGVSVERIRMDVRVTRDGEPVRGLTASDFEVRDSGVLQPLEPAVVEGGPVDTVLILDLSQSVSGGKLEALRLAVQAYLEQVRPGERVALVGFAGRAAMLVPFTEDTARLRAAVTAARPGGATALCDAVYAGLRLPAPADRRRAVVAFSDGLDNVSWLSAGQLVEAARRTDAVLYGVLAGVREERDQSVLREVTKATGGRVFDVKQPSELRGRFLEVLEDIRSRYVLSFSPQGVGGSGWHPLAVRLKRRRGEVVARPGYWRSDSQP
jgi:VWFA-related protein